MDDAQQPGARMLRQRGGNLFEGEDVTPGRFDRMDRGAAPFHHVFHPSAEDPIDADDDFITRLDEIGRNAFHARHAGAADGEGERVLCAEDLAEQLARLVHDGDILRVNGPRGWLLVYFGFFLRTEVAAEVCHQPHAAFRRNRANSSQQGGVRQHGEKAQPD
jgi:hypothetical protein